MVKNKTTPPKKSPSPKTSRENDEAPTDDGGDDDRPLSPRKRKRLLARVAGNIAAGIMQAPSESTSTPDAIAEVSVDIGEAILERVGL